MVACSVAYEHHNLGCDYDGGDCCTSPLVGCRAPWFSDGSVAGATAAAPWRFAATTGGPDAPGDGVTVAGVAVDDDTALRAHATVPHNLHEAMKDILFLEVRT